MKSKARETERDLDKKVNLYYLAARAAYTRFLTLLAHLFAICWASLATQVPL